MENFEELIASETPVLVDFYANSIFLVIFLPDEEYYFNNKS